MVEVPVQILPTILFVVGRVLHVRVPHEICYLVRHNYAFRLFRAEVQEIDVLLFAFIEGYQVQRTVFHEWFLSQTGFSQPLLTLLVGISHAIRGVVQGMELKDAING